MKRYFFLALTAVMALSAQAQRLETLTEYPTGYLETAYYSSGNTIASIDGVLYLMYSNVPCVLLRYPAGNTREEYEIPATVRRIAKNAFQGTKYLKTLKIHEIVTLGNYIQLEIGDDAFNDSSIEEFVVLTGKPNYVAPTTVTPQSPNEVARYDVSGRPTTSESGIQIVKYDDGSGKKTLNKY